MDQDVIIGGWMDNKHNTRIRCHSLTTVNKNEIYLKSSSFGGRIPMRSLKQERLLSKGCYTFGWILEVSLWDDDVANRDSVYDMLKNLEDVSLVIAVAGEDDPLLEYKDFVCFSPYIGVFIFVVKTRSLC